MLNSPALHLLRINAVCKTARAVASPRRRLAALTPQATTRPRQPPKMIIRPINAILQDCAGRSLRRRRPALGVPPQAAPHKTPPSTPSTIFRKTVSILHSGVKVLSAQKNAHFLLRFRFFVLPLGQAIRRTRRESHCCIVNLRNLQSAAIRGSPRRVVNHVPDW